MTPADHIARLRAAKIVVMIGHFADDINVLCDAYETLAARYPAERLGALIAAVADLDITAARLGDDSPVVNLRVADVRAAFRAFREQVTV